MLWVGGRQKFVSGWVKVGGASLYVRHGGAGNAGLPIVLVHGLAVSGRYLLPTARLLAATKQVWVPDLPGFGRLGGPWPPLTITESADVLAAWMKSMHLGPAQLLANSLGCQICVDMAVRYPELVADLILIAPVWDPTGPNLLRQFGRALADLPYEPLRFSPLAVADYLRAGLFRTVLTARNAKDYRIDHQAPNVLAPTVIVHGEKDPIVSHQWVEALTRLFPYGRLVVVPGAGHAINYTRPEELTSIVT